MTQDKKEQAIAKINSIRLRTDNKLQQEHATAAANAASLYVHVLQALDDIVPDEQLHAVAATITAGMVSAPAR